MFLICHVIPQDHVIKKSCDFMNNNLLRQKGGSGDRNVVAEIERF